MKDKPEAMTRETLADIKGGHLNLHPRVKELVAEIERCWQVHRQQTTWYAELLEKHKELEEENARLNTMRTIDIVFDGEPLGPNLRFIETEENGKSIALGEWIRRDDGLWAIRFCARLEETDANA